MSGDLSGFSLMELFRMEAETHTATLSAGLVSLEGTSAAPEVIDPLMRARIRSKEPRIVGLDAIVRVAHAMEDCFVQAQKGKLLLRPEHVDVLLRGVDMLARVAQQSEAEVAVWQTEHADEIDVMVTDLQIAKDDRLPIRTDRSDSVPPPPHRGRRRRTPKGHGNRPNRPVSRYREKSRSSRTNHSRKPDPTAGARR